MRPNKRGMTLIEILIATVIFLVAIVGLVYSYLKCMELADLGRNSSLAMQAIESKVEDIKNTPFASIYSTYNNATFTTSAITNGRGVVYIDNSNAHFYQIKVVFCWKQQNGRVIGEDTNLNGSLNAGEDKNGNGQIDSYAQIITYIYG